METLNNAEVIDIHPPLDGITFTITNTSIIAASFKSITQNLTEDSKQSTKMDIKNIECQDNYTNQILSTMANQLTRIEDMVNIKITPSSSFPWEGSNQPLFKPFEFPKTLQPKLTNDKFSNDYFLEQIQQKLDKLSLGEPRRNPQINVLNHNLESDDETEKDNDSQIDTLDQIDSIE